MYYKPKILGHPYVVSELYFTVVGILSPPMREFTIGIPMDIPIDNPMIVYNSNFTWFYDTFTMYLYIYMLHYYIIISYHHFVYHLILIYIYINIISISSHHTIIFLFKHFIHLYIILILSYHTILCFI